MWEAQSSKDWLCKNEKNLELDTMIKLINYINILQVIIEEQDRIIRQFEQMIHETEDERARQLFYKKYIQGKPNIETIAEMGISNSVLKKIHQKNIKELKAKVIQLSLENIMADYKYKEVKQHPTSDECSNDFIDNKINIVLISTQLNHEERLFILLRFLFGKSLEQISEYFGFSNRHVQQYIQKQTYESIDKLLKTKGR